MTPIIIDVEGSGFGPESYPVEVGLALRDGTRHCYLVAPQRSWRHWDAEAERIHGISRTLLETHGRPAREVAWRLNALLAGRTVYSDGAAFSIAWLDRLYRAVRMQRGFEVADLSELLDAQQRERWLEVKQAVSEALALKRHRASGDAWILQETWRRLNARAAA